MSGQSKKSHRSWLPGWLTTPLLVRKLRREVHELDSRYGRWASETKVEERQDILAEWSFKVQWPKSELAQLESARLRRLARRWNVDSPSSEHDCQTGRWYIPDAPRGKLRREIRDAKRQSIKWWIQVVVVPMIALVSSATALIALLLRLQ